MKPGFKSLLIAGLLANTALGVQAQTMTSPDSTKPIPNALSPRMHEGRMDPAKMEAMMTKRLADLKTKLNITAPQDSAWITFTTAMKPVVRTDHLRPDRAAMDKLTTPERIDKMRALRAQHMTEKQAEMEKRADATKTFYAALNADQKKVFDAEHSKMMHRWGDRKGMGHGSRHETPGASVKP